MAKIILNEGTKIEVKESKVEIRTLIAYRKEKSETDEKMDENFIKLTMVSSKYLPITETVETEIDLNEKRILFYHD